MLRGFADRVMSRGLIACTVGMHRQSLQLPISAVALPVLQHDRRDEVVSGAGN
jgi:hypothetical protein